MHTLITALLLVNLECLQDIVLRFSSYRDTLMCVNVDLSMLRAQIAFNPELADFVQTSLRRIDLYYGSLHDGNVKSVFEGLKNMLQWNSRAKFVFEASSNLSTIFEVAARYYVYNIVVIQEGKVYTYDPYVRESVDNPDTKPMFLGNCTDSKVNFFPEKLPKFWRNTTLTAITVLFKPYVLSTRDKKGFEIEILERLIAPRFHFKVQYVDTKELWGIRLDDGSYTQNFGLIQSGGVDFGIGHFHVRAPTGLYDFDVTFSFTEDDVLWMVPVSLEIGHWMNLLRIFDVMSWVIILTTIAFASLSWTWICKASPIEVRYYRTAWHSAMVPIKFALAECPQEPPESLAVRLLFVATWIYVFIVFSVWEARLLYHLIFPAYAHQIDTLTEVLDSNLNFVCPPEIELLYLQSDRKIGLEIKKRNLGVRDKITRMSDHAAINRDAACLSSWRCLKYIIPKVYTQANGRWMIHRLREKIIVDYTVWPFRKGHPCFEAINGMLIYLRSGGLIDWLDKQVEFETSLQAGKTTLKKEAAAALTFNHLKGVLMFLVLAYFAACCLFSLEVFKCL